MSKKNSLTPWLFGGALVAGGLVLQDALAADRAQSGANLPLGKVGPGWYWALVKQTDLPAWSAMRAAQPGAILPRKTAASTPDQASLPLAERTDWVLFEVTRIADWMLPGRPAIAPRGAATTPSDVLGTADGEGPSITSPDHPWNKFWSGQAADEGGPGNPLLELARALDTAIPWLIYGGVAILGVKLWMMGGAPDTSALARRRA